MTDTFESAGKIFSELVQSAWVSEEEMSNTLTVANVPFHGFNRTDHGKLLCTILAQRALAASGFLTKPVDFDYQRVVLSESFFENPDICWSVKSQILLNLAQSSLIFNMFSLDTEALQKEVATLEENDVVKVEKAAGNKFTKMATAESHPSLSSDNLGTLRRYVAFKKALKTDSLGGQHIPSFRVTPIGSTPALADSYGLSGLSPYLDYYLIGASKLRQHVIHWDKPVSDKMVEQQEAGVSIFSANGLYTPSSGTDILSQSMMSRLLTFKLFSAFRELKDERRVSAFIMPRLTTVTVYTNPGVSTINETRSILEDLTSKLRVPMEMFSVSDCRNQ